MVVVLPLALLPRLSSDLANIEDGKSEGSEKALLRCAIDKRMYTAVTVSALVEALIVEELRADQGACCDG